MAGLAKVTKAKLGQEIAVFVSLDPGSAAGWVEVGEVKSFNDSSTQQKVDASSNLTRSFAQKIPGDIDFSATLVVNRITSDPGQALINANLSNGRLLWIKIFPVVVPGEEKSIGQGYFSRSRTFNRNTAQEASYQIEISGGFESSPITADEIQE